jgi:hypothetical protein
MGLVEDFHVNSISLSNSSQLNICRICIFLEVQQRVIVRVPFKVKPVVISWFVKCRLELALKPNLDEGILRVSLVVQKLSRFGIRLNINTTIVYIVSEIIFQLQQESFAG